FNRRSKIKVLRSQSSLQYIYSPERSWSVTSKCNPGEPSGKQSHRGDRHPIDQAVVCGRVDHQIPDANFDNRERRHSFPNHFAILEQLEIDLVVADRDVVGNGISLRNAARLKNVTPSNRSLNRPSWSRVLTKLMRKGSSPSDGIPALNSAFLRPIPWRRNDRAAIDKSDRMEVQGPSSFDDRHPPPRCIALRCTVTRHRTDHHADFLFAERSSSILRSHFISLANARASSGGMNTVSFSAG